MKRAWLNLFYLHPWNLPDAEPWIPSLCLTALFALSKYYHYKELDKHVVIVHNGVSSPVWKRQFLQQMKPSISLLHVALKIPNMAITALKFFGLVLSLSSICSFCCPGIAPLHLTDRPMIDPVLHSQLFSPPVLSFQILFKCYNINLIWEDKEEAKTFF